MAQSTVSSSTSTQPAPAPSAVLPKRVKRMLVAVSKAAIWSTGSLSNSRKTIVAALDGNVPCVRGGGRGEEEREREEEGADQHGVPCCAPGARQTMRVGGQRDALHRVRERAADRAGAP